jgi:aminoglycoside phosphotransferase (APT) family kinase protein
VLDVRRLIESQFPEWSDLPITPAEPQGWDNRRFRLGEELVVRLPRDEAYAAQVEKEQRWLPVCPGPAATASVPSWTSTTTPGRAAAAGRYGRS